MVTEIWRHSHWWNAFTLPRLEDSYSNKSLLPKSIILPLLKERYMQKNNIKLKKTIQAAHLKKMNLMAAGIDVGSRSHYVAIPEGLDEVTVREFATFTGDLNALADWLQQCGITTVAMESTGVYWIPLYEILESRGFEVKLVDARHVKNVSGRKTDVLDCQWIQQLHTYGLLQGAFRPNETILELRGYLRQRHQLIQQSARHIQHMQKALTQMNLLLHNVLSDITGDTGMKIIRAIVRGIRDPKVLAHYRNGRCKNSEETIEKSLQGNYRPEHLFLLTQSLELYDVYQEKIQHCDEQIERCLSLMESKKEITLPLPKKQRSKKHKYDPNAQIKSQLHQITGVDLTQIPGIETNTALKLIAEIGVDLSRWKTAKQFASWLGVCPGTKVSGGKRLSSKTKRTSNYAASALRMAASSLHGSKTALGAFFRRLKGRIGAPKATTAAAHKLATIIFNMLVKGQEYVERGQAYYEQQYKERVIRNLTQRASDLGLELVPKMV